MDDIALPQHHRAGAHRARRHPVVVTLAALGSVAVVSGVLVWLLLAVDVLGVRNDLVGGAPTAQPSPGPSSGPAPATGPAPSAEPAVDRSVVLDVLNSTGTGGLAAGAADRLQEAGWTVGEVGNYPDGELPTTVFYGSEELAATAAAVVVDLGTGAPALSADLDDDQVTAVLGPDYEG